MWVVVLHLNAVSLDPPVTMSCLLRLQLPASKVASLSDEATLATSIARVKDQVDTRVAAFGEDHPSVRHGARVVIVRVLVTLCALFRSSLRC
jgi:hypothetical protein